MAASPLRPRARSAPAPVAAAPAPAPAPPAAPAAADTPEARGKALFSQPLIGSQAGCMTCHKVDTDDKIVGPSLKGIKERAATRVEGKSAEEYLKASILAPNEYVVEGFVQGLMPAGYREALTDDQLNDVVAYLMSI